MRRAAVLACALLGSLLLAPTGAAQVESCSAPQVSVLSTDIAFEPGEVREVAVSLTNPNSQDATANLSASVPEGWTVSEPDDADVGATSSTEVTLRVTAPQADDAAGGDLEVGAALTCGSEPFTTTSSSSTASGSLVYQEPETSVAWIAVGAVALVAAGGGAVAYRRRPSGLEADCPQPVQEAAPGGRVSFELAVENPRDAPDTASIAIRDPPPGWKAFATVSDVEIAAAEVRTPTVAVVVPEDAEPGDSARFAVEVASGRSGDAKTVPVRVDVVPHEDAGTSGTPDVRKEQHS